MKVLVACEYSGVVREAFRRRGHDAWSCDIIDAEDGSPYHLKGDALSWAWADVGWDLMIAHPPCTYIALCQIWRKYKPGQEWRKPEEDKAIGFFKALHKAPIKKKCLENPKSVASTKVAPKTQTIHPWQHGHPEQKETWLWLEGLDPLVETNNVYEHMMTLPRKEREKIHFASPNVNRGKDRSRTYFGIAEAMAEQWGG